MLRFTTKLFIFLVDRLISPLLEMAIESGEIPKSIFESTWRAIGEKVKRSGGGFYLKSRVSFRVLYAIY